MEGENDGGSGGPSPPVTPAPSAAAGGPGLEARAPRRALVAGASGLVGGFLLRELLAAVAGPGPWGEVVSIGRRRLPLVASTLVQHEVRFDHLDGAGLPPCDEVFCALGTTLARAGSRAAFRQVDFDFVLALARWASAHGVRQFLVVSSMSADPRSPVFYSRVKGELEEALAALELPSLAIVRPSLLGGERAEQRLGERLTVALARALDGLLPAKYRVIPAATVACAMVRIAGAARPGRRVYPSDELRRIAASP